MPEASFVLREARMACTRGEYESEQESFQLRDPWSEEMFRQRLYCCFWSDRRTH